MEMNPIRVCEIFVGLHSVNVHGVDAVDPDEPIRVHVVKLATTKLGETRRRVQNETMGYRGRKDDPLYRIRRLFTKADERLTDKGRTKLVGFLAAGDLLATIKPHSCPKSH